MKKLLNKKGFTLMEMLIVIAIIVILIAIAVPNFNNSLNSANEATDKANFKAAETAAVILAQDPTNNAGDYFYDVSEGALDDGTPDETDNGKCKTHTGAHIQVTIGNNGDITVKWSNSKNCGE